MRWPRFRPRARRVTVGWTTKPGCADPVQGEGRAREERSHASCPPSAVRVLGIVFLHNDGFRNCAVRVMMRLRGLLRFSLSIYTIIILTVNTPLFPTSPYC